MTLLILESQIPAFIAQIQCLIAKLGISVSSYSIDHVCWRTATQEEYCLCKKELGLIGTLLIESIIGGRLISVFKLATPISCDGREIDVIELPSPKAGSEYASGLEHCEFVVDESLENFVSFGRLIVDGKVSQDSVEDNWHGQES